MTVTFTNSCAPITYPCLVGEKFIDPCTCRSYLECKTGGYDFVSRNCGRGTAWNHQTGFCIRNDEIFIADGTPICVEDKPWRRCSSVMDHYNIADLKDDCDPGASSEIDEPGSASNGGGGDSAGPIVGGVLGAVAVIVIIVVAVIWWRKRQNGKDKENRPSLPKRHPDPEEQDEEVYDVIDERIAQRSPISNAIYEAEKSIEYDNPSYVPKSGTNEFFGLSQQPGSQATGFQDSAKGSELNGSSKDSAIGTSVNHNASVLEEDLTRSIAVDGREVLVEDNDGYHVGYPSGSIPRQPSPRLSTHDGHNTDHDGYSLDNTTYKNDYTELERTEL